MLNEQLKQNCDRVKGKKTTLVPVGLGSAIKTLKQHCFASIILAMTFLGVYHDFFFHDEKRIISKNSFILDLLL